MGHFLLILATMIWGGAFVAVKWVLPFLSAQQIHLVRVVIAGLVSLLYFLGWWFYNRVGRRRPSPTYRLLFKKSFWWPPLVCGSLLYLMLALQTEGLALTTVARSGFITCLYVLFVPLLIYLMARRTFSLSYWLYCGLSLLGIYLLLDANFENLNRGDFLTLLCALVAALHIIAIDRFACHYEPLIFNGLQCLVMAIISLLVMLSSSSHSWSSLFGGLQEMSALAIWGLVVLGIFSSFFAFAFQIYAQKMIPPSTVTLLFLLESPFAALFGFLWLQESLSFIAIIGGLLVLFSAYRVSMAPKSA